jgi:hypothetical protein
MNGANKLMHSSNAGMAQIRVKRKYESLGTASFPGFVLVGPCMFFIVIPSRRRTYRIIAELN